MKHVQRNLVLFALTLATFAASAQAQLAITRIKVDVPFEFSVGKKTFPAGQYSIVKTSPDILSLRNSREMVLTTTVISRVLSTQPHVTPVLVFRIQGGRRQLTQVWDGSTYGFEFPHFKPSPLLAKSSDYDTQVATESSAPSN